MQRKKPQDVLGSGSSTSQMTLFASVPQMMTSSFIRNNNPTYLDSYKKRDYFQLLCANAVLYFIDLYSGNQPSFISDSHLLCAPPRFPGASGYTWICPLNFLLLGVYSLFLIQMVQFIFKLHCLLLKPRCTYRGPDSGGPMFSPEQSEQKVTGLHRYTVSHLIPVCNCSTAGEWELGMQLSSRTLRQCAAGLGFIFSTAKTKSKQTLLVAHYQQVNGPCVAAFQNLTMSLNTASEKDPNCVVRITIRAQIKSQTVFLSQMSVAVCQSL